MISPRLSRPFGRTRRAIVSLALLAAVGSPTAFAQLNPHIRGPVLSTNDLRGDFVAAGTGLRGTGGTGTITIVGIPPDSFVKEALLYWAVLDNAQTAQAGQITFAGNAVTGALIGSTPAPCGSAMSSSFVYRADVTPYVTGNGPYAISGAYDSGNVAVAPVTEGASLVIIYSNVTSANRDIVIYEGASVANSNGAQVSSTLSFFNGTTPVTGATLCYIVGDGQSGLSDSAFINGLSAATNIFDGSDAPAGLDYWDTDTIDATAFLTGGVTSFNSAVQAGTDCILWVATPFSITSPYPPADIVTENLTPNVPQGTRFQMRVTASNTSGSNVPVFARIDVFRQPGALVGTMLQNKGGTLPAGATVQKVFGRNIPRGVPPGLTNQPLYILTTLTNRLSGAFIDDDYVIMYVR